MSMANPTLEDVWQLFRESALQQDASKREADRRFQETERLLKEQALETDRRFKETAQEIKKVTVVVGKLSNRLGEFVENAVRPAAVRLFQERGIAVHEVYHGVSVQRDNEELEIDLLVVNDQDAVIIECKSNLGIEDIKDHLERLNKVKRLMPKYTNSRILGAVASMVLSDEIIKYAYRQGLYIICQSGTDLFIHNDDKFVPRIW